MAHDDHYHVHSSSLLPPPPVTGPPAAPPSSATVTLTVPQNTAASGTVTMQFYSLQRDLAQLRRDATAKGILSSSDRVDVGTSDGPFPQNMLSLVIGGHLWPGPGPVPKVLIVGCHHAREWISVEIPYLIAEYLIEKYNPAPGVPANQSATPGTVAGQAQRIKHLVGNREIWFVPMVNPEGHTHTIIHSRKWRPNRFIHTFTAATTIIAPQHGGGTPRIITVPAGTTCMGVDVNRNYASADWGQETIATNRDPRDGGSNTLFSGQVYCGLTAESERETIAIAGLIRARNFASLLSYHNYAQEIYAPDATFTQPFTESLGRGMQSMIGGGTYAFMASSASYPTTGDPIDYYIQRPPPSHHRPAYTIELSPKDPPAVIDHKFSGLPETEIQRVFRENLAAALALINCAGFSSAPNRTRITTVSPAHSVVTVIPNCWNRFRGWDPTI